MKYINIMLIFSILICSCSKTYEVYAPLTKGAKIMAFGDSLTFGYGSETSTYPKNLQKITDYTVVNYGVNGDTTETGLNRLEAALTEESPQLIIIGLGGNDMLNSVKTETIVKNLKAMIEISKKHNVQVVLLPEPQPRAIDLILGSAVVSLSDAEFYKKLAKEEKILNLDDVYSSLLSKQENKSDLIHLNEKGYKEAAVLIAEKLKKAKIL